MGFAVHLRCVPRRRLRVSVKRYRAPDRWVRCTCPAQESCEPCSGTLRATSPWEHLMEFCVEYKGSAQQVPRHHKGRDLLILNPPGHLRNMIAKSPCLVWFGLILFLNRIVFCSALWDLPSTCSCDCCADRRENLLVAHSRGACLEFSVILLTYDTMPSHKLFFFFFKTCNSSMVFHQHHSYCCLTPRLSGW